MVYNIVVWIYDNIGYDNFKNKDSLRQAALAKDKFGSIEDWMNSSKNWLKDVYAPTGRRERGHSKQGTTLREGIDEWNEKEIKGIINNARSRADLNSIDMNEIESNDIKGSLQKLIDDKANGFEQDVVKQFRDTVRDATSQEDLGDISFGAVEREYGADAAREVRQLVDEKSNQLKSLAEDAFDKAKETIDGADSVERLRDVQSRLVDMQKTTVNEDTIRDLIKDKQSKLEAEQEKEEQE